MSWFTRLAGPFLAAALTGCATMGTLQTAETNGEGNLQGAVELSAFGVSGGGESIVLGQLNGSVRYGVSDSIDIGGSFGTSGARFTTKFMLTPPKNIGSGGPIVSIAPSIGGFFLAAGGAGVGSYSIDIPVIIGIPVGRSQFVLAPKINTFGFVGGGGGEGAVGGVLIGGASVGFAARTGENFRVMPEVTFLLPLVAYGSSTGGGGGTADLTGVNGLVWNIGFGFLFGGRPDAE